MENYAVIWVSNNKQKYGYIIYKNLMSKWKNVFPVNPNEDNIEWKKCYGKIWDLENIDMVIFVTPPAVSYQVLKQCLEVNMKNVWFQPWSSDEKCTDFCKKNDIKFVQACIL